MKQTLENLRSRPHHVRMMLVFIFAGTMTALIIVGWAMTPNAKIPKKQLTAPGPVDALAGSIKNVWQTNKKTTTDVEIINTSNDVIHDETNPYQQ